MSVVIPFGEWLPDLAEYGHPGALEARNVIPLLRTYGALPDLQPFTDALDNAALSMFWMRDSGNAVFNFAADTDKLYRLDVASWVDVSGTSSPYSATGWQFTKYGSRAIAVAPGTDPQYYDVDTDSTFSDLPNAPRAKAVATVRDFVMLGNLDLQGPNFVRWSGFNNSEEWTPSIRTQADFQELFGRGGAVQRIIGGEYALIFCENSVYRADYVGPRVIFQIDELENSRGTPAPNSVIRIGQLAYFFGWDGFYAHDGAQARSISNNRVSDWFLNNCPPEAYEFIEVAHDRRRRLVVWAFRTSASLAHNDRLLIYNWGADRWAYGAVNTQVIGEMATSGLTLDVLDDTLGLIDSASSGSVLVDSAAYDGGGLSMQGFSTLNEMGVFSGAPLAAILDTSEIDMQGRRFTSTSVRPLIEGAGDTPGGVTVQIGHRNRLLDTPSFDVPSLLNSFTGEADKKVNARYQRYRVHLSDGFTHAIGMQPTRVPVGGRG